MAKQSAAKLKVQLPLEDNKRESESDVKREYLDESGVFSSCMGTRWSSKSEAEQPRASSTNYSNSSEYEEKQRGEKSSSLRSSSNDNELDEEIARKKSKKSRGLQCLKQASDGSSDEESEVEEKVLQDTDRLATTEVKEDDIEAQFRDEKPPGEDTDSDDDGWPSLRQGKREVESKKKADEVVDESDDEWREDEWREDEWREEEWNHKEELTQDENKGMMSQGDISQAKFILRNITSRIPLVEETAIRRGVKLSGPPLEFATTHLDEYARKFRWPQHVRNLRYTNFSQDPTEIFEDFELLATDKQSDSALPVSSFLLKRTERDVSQDSAFAQVPRPMVALAAGALRRLSRKRKRTAREDAPSGFPSAPTLLNFARVGGQFGDHFVESLLSANGKALQGIDSAFNSDIDRRCWSSLPTKKKPIANWRFVLEHIRRTMGRSAGCSDAVYPPMKHETLKRITNRLRKLHGCTTQHEENDILERGMPTVTETNATEALYKTERGTK